MDWAMHDISALGALLRKREISVAELAQSCLHHIRKRDETIGAFLEVTEEKASQDILRAQERIDRGDAGPLTGIPYGLKDNLCTRGIRTTCASGMLESFLSPYDATAVSRLEKENGVLLGKLNMDEFAMGSSTENSAVKVTRNPHDLSRVPGGSSGGAAAAVAAGMTVFSLGSDTGGSIRQPASFCGVTGLKPTYGRVSRYGLIAFASSLDQVGTLTRSVRDAALILPVIAGKDPLDSTSADVECGNLTRTLEDGVKGLRVAVPVNFLSSEVDADIREKILDRLNFLEREGAVCREVELKYHDGSMAAYYILASAEASSNLARFDGVKYGLRAQNAENLTDLMIRTRSQGFGAEVKRRIMMGTYVLSSDHYDAYYLRAQKVQTLIREELRALFETCDVVAGPTTPTTAFRLGEKISDPLAMCLGDVFTVSASLAGLPAVSLPVGKDRAGLPIGMQIMGKPFDEETILRCARVMEADRWEKP